jgi:hypothetical protein
MSDRFWRWVLSLLGRTQKWIYTTRLKRHVWKSFNDTVTPLDELDDDHLANILRKLIREGHALEEPLFPFLLAEARSRERPNHRLKKALLFAKHTEEYNPRSHA